MVKTCRFYNTLHVKLKHTTFSNSFFYCICKKTLIYKMVLWIFHVMTCPDFVVAPWPFFFFLTLYHLNCLISDFHPYSFTGKNIKSHKYDLWVQSPESRPSWNYGSSVGINHINETISRDLLSNGGYNLCVCYSQGHHQ